MIRAAEFGDIEYIVKLGARMAEQAKLATGYHPDSVRVTLKQLIESPDGILLVSETGMIGGLCYPHPFNHTVKIGQEFFWYSEGKDGADLLDAAEVRARECGASHWTMLSMETMRPKLVGRVLERRGYVATERSYIKEL